MRTFAYVDALNLYYGSLKGTRMKWLDLKTLIALRLPPHHQIEAIKYFTARVSGADDLDAPKRQDVYLRALNAHTPEIDIIYGHFARRKKKYQEVGTLQIRRVWVPEEKGSDVNLSVHLLNDAWLGVFDAAVIVTNDSDMAEALHLVAKHHPMKHLTLLTPGETSHVPAKLLKPCHEHRHIKLSHLRRSQLPNPLTANPRLSKPKAWNTAY